LTTEDTGGLSLQWGDKQVVAELVRQTGENKGFGQVLAKGARFLGKKFGCEEAAVQVNGLELPYHDPRGSSGMAISYATSPRGACHNQSDYFFVDIYGQVEEALGMRNVDSHDDIGKIGNIVIHQNWRTLFNALGMCYFANVPPESVLGLVNAAAGTDLTLDDLMQIGERGWTIKRLLNRKFGLTKVNDRLPKPLLEPYQDGGSSGYVIPFREMIEAYYSARCWDVQTGFPEKEKTRTLGLTWAV